MKKQKLTFKPHNECTPCKGFFWGGGGNKIIIQDHKVI